MRYKFIILFLILGFVSKAQVYQLMPQYGYNTYRMNFDSTIQIPTFCGVPKLGSNVTKKGALAFDSCNNRFYFFNPKLQAWDTIKSGSTVDTTKFVRYTDTSAMLAPYFKEADTSTLRRVKYVGLTMPSAFNVTGSPITDSGTIAVTGAGTASQYVRGDGVLASFPTATTGGGASVSYYLNGSVNKGTFGGQTYYEMSRTAIIGAGTDFTRLNTQDDGLVAQFITDTITNLLIPAGNWNLELYFNASSGGGTPSFYVELYKYDGANFTLISSNSTSPELIAFGTTINPYFCALAVPETILSGTDRLAIRVFVNTSGRSITLHTENSHLCQVITTFTTGLTAINGLTKQVQYFAVGTSGTDFNISSSNDTHTFNLPTASPTNRGALSSTDWSTFNSKLGSSDTISLSNRINTKLNISDTSGMLNSYLRKADTVTLSNRINLKQDALTLTTTGTSGAATLIGATLNIPQYSGTNIYNSDGTLTGNRTLSVSNNSLTFGGSANAASGTARPYLFSPSLTATANNDFMSGLDINPTFSNGAFTGVKNSNLRLSGNTTGTYEGLTFFNNDVSGDSYASIRYRNTFTGNPNTIWSSIDLGFAPSAGGKILLRTSNANFTNATTKLVIDRTDITSLVTHNFTGGISGNTLNVFTGAIGDAAPGIVKNLATYISTGGANSTASLAVGNTVSQSANTNAHGIYINNQATVSGTGQRFNISSVGSALNHFAGNTLIGTTTNDASALLNVSSTSQGFLQPRMTTSQMNAISTPATGLSVFNTTDSLPYVYRGTGSGWQKNVTYTRTNDIGLLNGADQKLMIEPTTNIVAGRALTVEAGSTQAGGTSAFQALGQTTRNWYHMAAAPNGDIYAVVFNGDIYRRTGGVGNFTALGQTTRGWVGIAAAPNGDIYASVNGGDLYKSTGGAFTALSAGNRNWWGMTVAPNGDVYAVVNGGDIYKSTNGGTTFTALGQTSRGWIGITAAPNGDVYACVVGGDIYKQTGGIGNFIALGQTSRQWYSMAATSNGDIYASVNGGDIYRQIGGTGNFTALSQTSRQWNGMAAAPNGDIYASVQNGDIYIQSAGTANLNGGTLVLQSGVGKGTGTSTINFNTGTTLASGAALQTASTKMTILGNGNVGIGTTSPSAKLELSDTARGFLQTRMTTTQMNAIVSPSVGLQVFTTTDSSQYVYRGTGAGWQQIANEIVNTASLNFPSTNAQTSSDLTITLTGAVDGDAVVLGVPNAAVNANSCYTAWVSAANTVTVRFNNYSSGAIDPASATFRVTIIK